MTIIGSETLAPTWKRETAICGVCGSISAERFVPIRPQNKAKHPGWYIYEATP